MTKRTDPDHHSSSSVGGNPQAKKKLRPNIRSQAQDDTAIVSTPSKENPAKKKLPASKSDQEAGNQGNKIQLFAVHSTLIHPASTDLTDPLTDILLPELYCT
jgi:hypothetical protein